MKVRTDHAGDSITRNRWAMLARDLATLAGEEDIGTARVRVGELVTREALAMRAWMPVEGDQPSTSNHQPKPRRVKS